MAAAAVPMHWGACFSLKAIRRSRAMMELRQAEVQAAVPLSSTGGSMA
jgi:hypothetical protein